MLPAVQMIHQLLEEASPLTGSFLLPLVGTKDVLRITEAQVRHFVPCEVAQLLGLSVKGPETAAEDCAGEEDDGVLDQIPVWVPRTERLAAKDAKDARGLHEQPRLFRHLAYDRGLRRLAGFDAAGRQAPVSPVVLAQAENASIGIAQDRSDRRHQQEVVPDLAAQVATVWRRRHEHPSMSH